MARGFEPRSGSVSGGWRVSVAADTRDCDPLGFLHRVGDGRFGARRLHPALVADDEEGDRIPRIDDANVFGFHASRRALRERPDALAGEALM